MDILMNGKSFDAKALEKWKRKHVISVYKNLGLSYDEEASTEQLCEVLTEKKEELGYDAIVAKIQNQLKLGDISLKMATKLSGKRRKKAMTTIYAEGIDVETLGKVIDHVTFLNTPENLKVNLSVCPEHYALVPREEELEVIEKTGNAPFPMQFFIRFNEEEGIQTPRDEEYPYQIVGIAKLKDGTIIGGVRHQFRNVEQGIEAVTCVEFPALCPNSIVKDHEIHLAVEWSGWIQWAIDYQDSLQNS